VVARDGVDGLDYLFGTGVYAGRDVRELPAVALLDVNLPKLDGLEMLEIIREHPYLCSLPVIMFTSSKAESDLIALFDHQANRCVRKPLEGLRLMESFRQLGLDWIGPHLPSLVPSEERV